MDNTYLPHFIRLGRKRANLSQERLAEVIGCDPTAVSHWERGKRVPSLDSAVGIAQALGLDVHERVIFGYELLRAEAANKGEVSWPELPPKLYPPFLEVRVRFQGRPNAAQKAEIKAKAAEVVDNLAKERSQQ